MLPAVPRLPLQLPDAVQLAALVEFQLRVVDCPCSMLDEDSVRFTTGAGIVGCDPPPGGGSDAGGTGSGSGKGKGSVELPCTTPVPASDADSVKFSSVLHAARSTNRLTANRFLYISGIISCEFDMDALQPNGDTADSMTL